MADLLVRGGRLVDLDGDPHRPPVVDILVGKGRIAAVAPRIDAPGAEVIEAAGRLVVPGFVNAHYHSHDLLLRGAFDVTGLEYWAINALPRAYPPRGDAELRLRTLLGAAECLRGGITAVQDMLTLFPLTARQVEVVRQAYEEAGLRAVLGLQVADVSPLDTTPFWRETIPPDLHGNLAGPSAPADAPDPLAVMDEILAGGNSDLVRWAICPSSPDRCSPALLDRLAALAARHDVPVCAHIYISRAEVVGARRNYQNDGGSLVRHLAARGLLNRRLTLAHGVWLDDAEIADLAAAGVSLAINPLSNLKTKNGAAPIRKLMDAGVNLGIGCDNCSCSDAQNMFQAMKTLTFLAAISDPADGPPDAIDAFRAATTGGARALGLPVGRIAPGMAADLVLLDLADPVYQPLNSAVRQIVYGESGRSVETVIVGGRVVMRDRKLVTIDEGALRAELDDLMPGFRRDAAAVFARTAPLRAYIAAADRRIWAEDIGFSRYVGFGDRATG